MSLQTNLKATNMHARHSVLSAYSIMITACGMRCLVSLMYHNISKEPDVYIFGTDGTTSSILKKGAANSSKLFVPIHQTTVSHPITL